MNVCNEGGPIVVFKDPPESRLAPQTNTLTDREWIDHCRSREFAERVAAKHARCGRAREAHQELAQAYARKIRLAEAAL